jgi:hypothetical protein
MQTQWAPILIDFGLMLGMGTFFAMCTALAFKQPHTLMSLFGTSVRNGAIGAGVAISVWGTVGERAAVGIATFISTALIGEDALREAIIKRFNGDSDARRRQNENPK